MKELLARWNEGPQLIRALRSDEGIAPYAGEEKRSDLDRARPEGTAEDTKGPGGPSPAAQDDRLRPVTYDCASAPMTEEAEEAEAKAKEAANRSAGAKAGVATRKRKLLEALEGLRARGVSMAAISAAGDGLTLNDVLDVLDRKPLPLPKLAALEKACKKPEEAEGSGGESS